MRIGIDLDGVVADFNAGWIARYNDEFGTNVAPAQMRAWNGMSAITHFSTEEFWRWARGGRGQPSIFRDLPLYEGAREGLERLAQDHHLVVVSSKSAWAIPDAQAWLDEQRLPFGEVHFTRDKASVPCEAYVEDGPHNLEALVAARPEAVVCRWVRPWNAPVQGAVAVRDWSEVVRALAGRPPLRGRVASGA